VAWRWPLIGGILITLLGIGLLYLFGFFDANRNLITFIVGMIPVIFGGLIIFCWGSQIKQHKNNHMHHGN
jgi:cytochrome c biogenesis protein CcdA